MKLLTLEEEEEKCRLRLETQPRRQPASHKDGNTITSSAVTDRAHDAARGFGTLCILDSTLDDIDGGDNRGGKGASAEGSREMEPGPIGHHIELLDDLLKSIVACHLAVRSEKAESKR